MATVTALVDRIQSLTGLSGSTEEAFVVTALNQAYEQSCAEAGIVIAGTGSAALTSGTDDYTLGTTPFNTTGFVEFRSLWLTGGGTPLELLERKTEDEIRTARQAVSSTTADPYWYAVSGESLLMLYPTPGAGLTLKFSFVKTPNVLIESAPGAGEESTPTAFDSAYHYSVLCNKALEICFEYKRDAGMADRYAQKYAQGLAELTAHVGRVGGAASDWIEFPAGVSGVVRNDEY